MNTMPATLANQIAICRTGEGVPIPQAAVITWAPRVAREIRMSGVDTTVDNGDDHARCCGVERGEGVLPGRLSADAPKGPLMAVERIVDDPRRSKDPILFSRLDDVARAAEVHEN